MTLCDAPVGRGGSWTTDARIIASLNSSGGLSRVPAPGGTPEPLTEIKGEAAAVTSHRWPHVLPKGAGLLFTAMPSIDAGGDLRVLPPTGSARTLVKRASDARYISSGHLLYSQSGTLFAVPFSLERLELSGPAMPIIEGLAQEIRSGAGGRFEFDVSSSGYARVQEATHPRFRAGIAGFERQNRANR